MQLVSILRCGSSWSFQATVPTILKIIRVMCTGGIDPSFILTAFSNGMDGVFIGGCWLGECHYLTEGNHHAVSMMNITKKIIKQAGIHTDRLRLDGYRQPRECVLPTW